MIAIARFLIFALVALAFFLLAEVVVILRNPVLSDLLVLSRDAVSPIEHLIIAASNLVHGLAPPIGLLALAQMLVLLVQQAERS